MTSPHFTETLTQVCFKISTNPKYTFSVQRVPEHKIKDVKCSYCIFMWKQVFSDPEEILAKLPQSLHKAFLQQNTTVINAYHTSTQQSHNAYTHQHNIQTLQAHINSTTHSDNECTYQHNTTLNVCTHQLNNTLRQ